MPQLVTPNVIYFHVDNLGYGELGCYGGGLLRGTETKRIDAFASEGFQLLNYAPEAQCSPSRAALMTGRYAIRSGNQTVALAGSDGGIIAWERTLGDIFSDAGYATMCVGKWHIGASDGRWPTDHGFDEWYGPPRSYDESLWTIDPFYNPKRDPVTFMMEGIKGEAVEAREQLTYELRRDVDTEYKKRAFKFIEESSTAKKPFFLYFNHSMMHLPTIPRDEYRGKSGNGDVADSLLELDGDFGDLLDKVDELGLKNNTIIVFAGDNGNEELSLYRGASGFFEGSYFTGTEASLRTPCILRWPGKIASGLVSNEIVHITDMFTTLLCMSSLPIPVDREIDGVDQSRFLFGEQAESNRDSFIYWNGNQIYGVKWRNFKLALVEQKYLTDPALPYATPRIINLIVDPKERAEAPLPYLHSWTIAHFSKVLKEFDESIKREPLIPAGAPLDYMPNLQQKPKQKQPAEGRDQQGYSH